MAKLKYDVSGTKHEDSVGREWKLPPQGVHDVKITAIDLETPPEKNVRLHIVARIINEKEADNYAPLHDYIPTELESMVWKLDQFLAAIGLTSKTKRKGELDTEKVKGMVVRNTIAHETDTYNGTTRTRAKLGIWLAKSSGRTKPTSVATDEPDDSNEEISLEMHGAAADGGDEESIAYLDTRARQCDPSIDPEEIATWAEVAAAIEEAEAAEPDTDDDAGADEQPGDEEWDYAEIAARADEDPDSITEEELDALYELAKEHNIEADEYPAWTEVVELCVTPDDEPDAPDYDAMGLKELQALARTRKLPSGGSAGELRERLAEYDGEDPFSED